MELLRGISGPIAGVEFPLDRDAMTLGRQDQCDIILEVDSVSREHARIVRGDGGYLIEDLQSRNGTYVNGVKVHTSVRLNNGDHIRICDVLLVFEEMKLALLTPDEDDATSTIMFQDGDGPSVESRLAVMDGSGLFPGRSVSPEIKLKVLLDIGRGLGAAINLDDVLPKLLDNLFVVFPAADRGFVILVDPRTGGLVPKAVRSRIPTDMEEFRVSRTVVETAMASKEAILSSDASQDSRFDASASIVNLDIHSMICAPLLDSNGEAMGVLQINSTRQGKRFSSEDLELLVSVAIQAARSIENAQLHEVALHEQALERELDIARKVQRSFLPSEQPIVPSYEFFDSYEAAKYLGGDYYDYAFLKDGRLAVILGDVSGKGVSASLFMVKLAAEMRYHLVAESTPSDVVKALNLCFCHERWEGRFVTLMMAVLDPTTHSLTLVNAGHMPPLIRSDDASIQELKLPPGLPLGIDEDAEYEEIPLSLEPGQAFMMYSDGLPDAMNSDEDWFGDDRLHSAFGMPNLEDVHEMGREVLRQIRQFVGRHPQFDDRCMAIIRRIE
jgi:phosphoserine phosphatase RsbU/P